MAQPSAAAQFVSLVEQADARMAAKDWEAAIPLWERVVASNPVEGRFWNQLGRARYRAKRFREAIPAWEKAIALGDGSPENTAYDIACAYARMNDATQAVAWLRRALGMGYLDLGSLATDPDLAAIRSDPRFAALVPVRDTAGMTRRRAGGRISTSCCGKWTGSASLPIA
jgi:tetratricopeptide (TPR) repeat protein